MTSSTVDAGIAHPPEQAAPSTYEIGKVGMWVFLAGETMVFGGFLCAFVLMGLYRGGWGAQGAHVNWPLGSINTLILFTSSMTAALAQAAARGCDLSGLKRFIGITALLGLLFLVVKGFEYAGDFAEGLTPQTGMFWSFYYLGTGLHTLHLLAGVVVFLGLFVMATPDKPAEWLERKLKYACLYWYFVELIWIFLFALVYLSPSVA
jgi:heme/copper-type cytochrome/quinol oxidase subunit 3